MELGDIFCIEVVGRNVGSMGNMVISYLFYYIKTTRNRSIIHVFRYIKSTYLDGLVCQTFRQQIACWDPFSQHVPYILAEKRKDTEWFTI